MLLEVRTMSKLIVIAGIKRSGSTWMYNAVRLILKHAGYSVAGGGEQHFDPNCEADYQIIKVHPFRPELAKAASYVFTSDRDDEGIRASWQRFSGEVLTDEKLATWRGWLKQWDEHTRCSMLFDELRNETQRRIVMKELAEILLLHMTLALVRRDLDNLAPPTDADYDPETLLFKNHITSA